MSGNVSSIADNVKESGFYAFSRQQGEPVWELAAPEKYIHGLSRAVRAIIPCRISKSSSRSPNGELQVMSCKFMSEREAKVEKIKAEK
ncbi:hypothetical protein [Fodinibius roseus]|uniref:hypothetical protein n=1 Tax=Fodinibius roseus TaxID=1194090 RepID=UPI000934FAEB|nr:hypothetical protein [Fodinibius roseus]